MPKWKPLTCGPEQHKGLVGLDQGREPPCCHLMDVGDALRHAEQALQPVRCVEDRDATRTAIHTAECALEGAHEALIELDDELAGVVMLAHRDADEVASSLYWIRAFLNGELPETANSLCQTKRAAREVWHVIQRANDVATLRADRVTR